MAADAAVLVTRPEGQAGELLEALRQAGFSALHQPLLELTPLRELSQPQQQYIDEIDRYRHVIFVSANAVRFGMALIDESWPQLPAGLNWYAVGGSTAALLAERGLHPLVPATTMDSEGLLALPELSTVEGQRVLIVKGEGGRQLLAQVLRERGARVDELSCYRRSCPELPPGALGRLLEAQAVGAVAISSGEGLCNMLSLLSRGETTKFRDVGLIVPSPRVAELAHRAGFRRVLVAQSAADSAVLEALRQWRAGD